MKSNYGIIAGAALLLPLAAPAPAAEWTVEEVLALHGAPQLDEVAEVHFDFVSGRGARSWRWSPITGDVFFEQDGVVVEYNRADIPPGAERIDRMWINDTFWLYWPMHAQWAADASITIEDPKPNPITDEPQPRLVIAYPPDGGGYTPGDRYEVYLGEDGIATAWTFHRGGAEEPSIANSIEGYVQAGPLLVPTAFRSRGADGFRLEMGNVRYRMDGAPLLRNAELVDGNE